VLGFVFALEQFYEIFYLPILLPNDEVQKIAYFFEGDSNWRTVVLDFADNRDRLKRQAKHLNSSVSTFVDMKKCAQKVRRCRAK
jgi:hypothetical protein